MTDNKLIICVIKHTGMTNVKKNTEIPWLFFKVQRSAIGFLKSAYLLCLAPYNS